MAVAAAGWEVTCLMVDEMSITTYAAAQTRRLGEGLGTLLEPGHVVLLSGDLGCGKTTFSQGVAAGLGVTADVTSPTYTLMAEYHGRIALVHADLYRLNGDANAVWETGIGDYIDGEGAVLIEWPEAIADELTDVLQVRIERAPLPRLDERDLVCRATGSRSWTLLDEWVKKWLF